MTQKSDLCEYCQENLKRPRSRFCSRTCQCNANNQKQKNKKIGLTCEICGKGYQVAYNYYSGHKNKHRHLCHECRGKNENRYKLANEPETHLELHDPRTEISWRELGLSQDAKEFPGLIFPESF